MPEYRHLGKPAQRKDGVGIVTGMAEFGNDLQITGMLHAKVKRSPHPHAEILRIDSGKALALPGVRAIITYENAPQWMCGLPDHRYVCDKKVRHVGDTVALVAAVTEEIAEQAVELIEVEYNVLPAVYDMDEAYRPGAPQLYDQFPNNIFPPGSPFEHGGPPFYQMKMGDCEKAFKECDTVTESEVAYDTLVFPGAPEPPVVIARWEDDGNVTIWGSTQHPGLMRAGAALRMGCHVDVISPNVGGSYGNKGSLSYITLVVCALAKATGKPVKFVMTKAEQMLVFEQRLTNRFKGRVGLKDGVVHAVDGMWIMDTGIFSDLAQGQMAEGLGELHLAMAKTFNWDIDSKLVATNRVPSGIVRGFGGQELKSCVLHAWTHAMKENGIDPFECMKKNFNVKGDWYYWRDGHQWENQLVDYTAVFEAAAEKFGWKEKWKGWGVPTLAAGNKVRGIGVGVHMSGEPGADDSEAYVRLEFDGSATVHCCVPETGQGQRLAAAKVAAEALNIAIEKVMVVPSQTGLNPAEFGLAGSRGTRTTGSAVALASLDARRQLLEQGAAALGIPVEDADTKDGVIFSKSQPEKQLPWIAIVHPYITITGFGRYKESFNAPNGFFTFVEVEIDTDTGLTEIVYTVGASDIGQIIDPVQMKMQFEGGIGSAGYDTAQMEEHIQDTRIGRYVTGNMIDYKWRTFNQIQKFDCVMLESQWDTHPYKAMGCGEVTGGGAPAAILMAIENALGGVDINRYPVTPDVVLRILGKA